MENGKENIYQNEIDSLAGLVQPDFRDEFLALIKKGNLGTYQNFLVQELAKKPSGTLSAFEYGVQHIRSINYRPDNALATYFLVLSSLTDLPSEFHDFATDCMVFCETEDDFVPASELTNLENRYKEISPLLKRNQ